MTAQEPLNHSIRLLPGSLPCPTLRVLNAIQEAYLIGYPDETLTLQEADAIYSTLINGDIVEWDFLTAAEAESMREVLQGAGISCVDTVEWDEAETTQAAHAEPSDSSPVDIKAYQVGIIAMQAAGDLDAATVLLRALLRVTEDDLYRSAAHALISSFADLGSVDLDGTGLEN